MNSAGMEEGKGKKNGLFSPTELSFYPKLREFPPTKKVPELCKGENDYSQRTRCVG